MNVLTFDVETTHTGKPNGGTTALPYFGNRLVSIGYKWLGEDTHAQRNAQLSDCPILCRCGLGPEHQV